MAKNVVVIGAGVGGSASAALLARAGYNVTLLETHPFGGGRCMGIERDGFFYDFGVHMFSRGHRGPHGQINRRLGGDLKWISRDPPCRVKGKVDFDFPLNLKPLMRQVKLAGQLGVKIKNYPGAFRLMRVLFNGHGVADNDPVCLQDFVARFTDDEMIHLFVNCVCQLYFAISYQEASAGEFIWSFSRMFNEASFGYPIGGGSEIPKSFINGLVRYGGEVHYSEPVSHIRIKNGRAIGVETRQGEYPADIVISNVGIAQTIDLAGRENFPQDYLERVEKRQYCNAYVTIKYALRRLVIPHPVVFYMPNLPPDKVFEYINNNTVPEDPYIFMPVPSNHDSTLAPPGQQLVIAGTAAPPGASNELCSAILDKVHAKVCGLFPELESALIWTSRSTRADATGLTKHHAGEAVGLAQTPSQTGRLRPEISTPVAGLWQVGADVGARGVGTEMASASALRLVDKIQSLPRK